jgi:hypothetical protein
MGTMHVDDEIILSYILNRRKALKCTGEGSRRSAETIVWEMEYYRVSRRKGTSYIHKKNAG